MGNPLGNPMNGANLFGSKRLGAKKLKQRHRRCSSPASPSWRARPRPPGRSPAPRESARSHGVSTALASRGRVVLHLATFVASWAELLAGNALSICF